MNSSHLTDNLIQGAVCPVLWQSSTPVDVEGGNQKVSLHCKATYELGEQSSKITPSEKASQLIFNGTTLVEPARLAPFRTSSRGKRVRFSQVTVFEFQCVLGDNPSVSDGPPIALSHIQASEVRLYSIDKYEVAYPSASRRRKQEFLLSGSERIDRCVLFTFLADFA